MNNFQMKNHADILNWATNCLIAKGYSLPYSPEIVQETPWSDVIRIKTATEDDQHCFLMKDAGVTLRQYLKTDFQASLLSAAIMQFTTIQRSTENHVESFLKLGVPDWRLNKLPQLYSQLLNQTDFLKSDGITDEELKVLRELIPKIKEQCELLAQYNIPETIVQPDFNTNNMLFEPNTKKMTLIDIGEIAISHPFFSLHNFLLQATIHHGAKEQDQLYLQLQDVCLENWQTAVPKKELLEAFTLSKKLWPIYGALSCYRLISSIDIKAFRAYYAKNPNKLAACFRDYIASI